MIKVINFKPSREELAELGTEIAFTLTDLKRLDGVTPTSTLPESQFQNLTYDEALDLYKNNGKLFFNSDPNQPTQTRIVLGNQNLTPASPEQVLEEIQKLEKLRTTLLGSLSTLTKISIDGYSRLGAIKAKEKVEFERDYLETLPIKVVPAKKSEVIQEKDLFLEYFSPSNPQDKKFFSYYIYSNTTQFWKVESADNTSITLNFLPGFQVGEYITIANLTTSFANIQLPSIRDYLYLKVKQVEGRRVFLDASEGFPFDDEGKLLSDSEVNAINGRASLLLALRGVPVLFAETFGGGNQGFALSLVDASKAILSDLPYTRLYSEKLNPENESASYLGNLERSSLQVTLIDDDREVALVQAGEATAGVSISYKLNTDSKKPEFGNVDVKLKLASIPALLRVSIGALIGDRALRLDARIKGTTAELSTPFSGDSLVDQIVSTATFISKTGRGDEDSREFYFNYQATTQKTNFKDSIDPITGIVTRVPVLSEQKIDLYKYGTIRLGEPLELLNAQRSVVQKVTIISIDQTTGTIVLRDPLATNVESGFYLRVPQSPLNPGREYRVTIGCKDKLATDEGLEMKQFVFKTKRLPQSQGVDGTFWEKINYGSIPPSLDISIPDSMGTAISAAISQIGASITGLNSSLLSTTQALQNVACSVGTFADNLKNIQTFADNFAKGQNNTAIYTRAIGLDPLGSIGSQASFLKELQRIVQDTNSSFPLPRLAEVEIPLDPKGIDGVLGSGDFFEQISENLEAGGTTGQVLGKAGISAFVGSKKRKLSNAINFESLKNGGGFPSNTISYRILTIRSDQSIATRAASPEYLIAYIERTDDLRVDSITISGARNSLNNGTFQVDRDFTSYQSFLGQTVIAIRYKNQNGTTEATSEATATFPTEGKIRSVDAIRIAFEKEKLIKEPGKSALASPKKVLEVLLKYKIVGVNEDLLEIDKSVALERLSLLAQFGSQRIGGVVLVGKAPSATALAAKLQSVADVIEYLKPLADKIALQAAQLESSKSGISRDRTEVAPRKLTAQNNTAIRDVEAVRAKIANSGVQQHKPIPLKTFKENPAPGVYDAWRKYTPAQLIPALKTYGVVDLDFDDTVGSATSTALSKILEPVGSIGKLLKDGQKQTQTFLNKMESQTEVINNLVEEINELNDLMTQGVNYLKNLVSRSNITLDAHLIGAKLNLATNEEFYTSVTNALNDFSDPNRPTFGPPPSTNFLISQNRLRGLVGGQLNDSTELWFGIVLIVVGKDSSDLGEQLRFLANILAMDDSSIAVSRKPTLTFQGLKI